MDVEHSERWRQLFALLGPGHDRALAFARRLSRSSTDGDDLFQEAVLRAFQTFGGLRDRERFGSWFCSVLISVHRNRGRRDFWRRFSSFGASGRAEGGVADGHDHADECERSERLARALATLPAVQRTTARGGCGGRDRPSLRACLGAPGVAVDVGEGGTVVGVRVETGSARVARGQADAFAKQLRRRGIEAEVAVVPWVVAVPATVYALAANRAEHAWIEVRARSAADIEGDVRARLAAAGFSETTLYVHREAGRPRVEARAVDPSGRVVETEHEERGVGPREEGALSLPLPDFSDLERLPLSERRTAIESRLRERGIDATVTLADGVLRIEAREQTVQTEGQRANPKEEP